MTRPSTSMTGVTVLVPAYNEEESLAGAVPRIRDNVAALAIPFEILIINDGSTDATGRIAEALAAGDPAIRVLHHERNRRIGAALRSAVTAARFEMMLLTPVDNPIPVNEMRALLDAAQTADIAVGYRHERAGYPAWMQFASRAYHVVLMAMFGMRLRDFNWCSMYRTDILRSLPLSNDGILAVPEVLIRAHRCGYRLVEVPLSMQPRTSVRRPTVNKITTLLRTLVDVGKLWFELKTGHAAAPRRARVDVGEPTP